MSVPYYLPLYYIIRLPERNLARYWTTFHPSNYQQLRRASMRHISRVTGLAVTTKL